GGASAWRGRSWLRARRRRRFRSRGLHHCRRRLLARAPRLAQPGGEQRSAGEEDDDEALGDLDERRRNADARFHQAAALAQRGEEKCRRDTTEGRVAREERDND